MSTRQTARYRRQVWHRDKGICQDCGLDTQAIMDEMPSKHRDRERWAQHLIDLYGFQAAELMPIPRPLWEVHHIVPLSQGGQNRLDNYVCLCRPCHRKRHENKQRRTA